ncbi:unnamed protein product, partial [Rotaria magnacalcarata]
KNKKDTEMQLQQPSSKDRYDHARDLADRALAIRDSDLVADLAMHDGRNHDFRRAARAFAAARYDRNGNEVE